jgi:acetate kinase
MDAAAAEPLIGVINAGSSSVKFSFYEGERRILTGQVDGIGAHPSASATGPNGEKLDPPDLGTTPTAPSEVLPAILPWARERLGNRRLNALGHRVVHGGLHHSRPARVTPELLAELEALVPLAPLHEPHNLAPIKMAMTLNPELPQVACFDTAFHRTAPEVEQAFALPYSFYEEGIRRYGFHGLSYEYIASVLPEHAPEIANGRVVLAHLGNGCSACAMQNRISVATTMGFTALDGLPMGTRCGELDAGVVLHLIQQKGMSAEALVDLLYRRSGMLGLSGISSDFRELLASESPRARFAVEVFAIALPAISPRWQQPSAVSTVSCSPPVSARMRRRCAARSAALVLGWSWSWTKRPMRSTRCASARQPAASPLMSSRQTKT